MQVFWKGLFELMICCLLQTVKAATFGIRRNLNKMTKCLVTVERLTKALQALKVSITETKHILDYSRNQAK